MEPQEGGSPERQFSFFAKLIRKKLRHLRRDFRQQTGDDSGDSLTGELTGGWIDGYESFDVAGQGIFVLIDDLPRRVGHRRVFLEKLDSSGEANDLPDVKFFQQIL